MGEAKIYILHLFKEKRVVLNLDYFT